MKNILVPTDLTDIAENGLKVAVDIAKMVRGKIFLVNFIRHPYKTSFSATGDLYTKYSDDENLFTVQLIRKHQADMEKLAEQYGDPELFMIKSLVYDSELKDGINPFIKENNIDLVVMGTSGEENFKEKFTGNHVEQVIAEAQCPVISVKADYRLRDMHHIVVGWDMKEQDEYKKAVKYINEFSDALKARLDIVYVAKPGKSNKEERTEKLRKFAGENNLTNYSLHIVEDQDVEDGLMKYATKVQAGIIVMLSESISGGLRFFTHSSTEDMTQESDLPVYTINLHNI